MTESNRFLDEQLRQVQIRDAEDRHSSCISRPRTVPPGWLLDKLAEEKLTGGWNSNRICPTCHLALTDLGKCPDGCESDEEPKPKPRLPRRNIARPRD